jgi:hypothetical protein
MRKKKAKWYIDSMLIEFDRPGLDVLITCARRVHWVRDSCGVLLQALHLVRVAPQGEAVKLEHNPNKHDQAPNDTHKDLVPGRDRNEPRRGGSVMQGWAIEFARAYLS